jgi:hypothetical protein
MQNGIEPEIYNFFRTGVRRKGFTVFFTGAFAFVFPGKKPTCTPMSKL